MNDMQKIERLEQLNDALIVEIKFLKGRVFQLESLLDKSYLGAMDEIARLERRKITNYGEAEHLRAIGADLQK